MCAVGSPEIAPHVHALQMGACHSFGAMRAQERQAGYLRHDVNVDRPPTEAPMLEWRCLTRGGRILVAVIMLASSSTASARVDSSGEPVDVDIRRRDSIRTLTAVVDELSALKSGAPTARPEDGPDDPADFSAASRHEGPHERLRRGQYDDWFLWVLADMGIAFVVWRFARRANRKRQATAVAQQTSLCLQSYPIPEAFPRVDLFNRDAVVSNVTRIAREQGKASALAWLQSHREAMPWPTHRACLYALDRSFGPPGY